MLGERVGKKVVAGEACADLDDVADDAEVFDIAEKKQFNWTGHGSLSWGMQPRELGRDRPTRSMRPTSGEPRSMYEVRPKWKGLSAYFEATTMWARESAGKTVVDDLSFEYPDRIRTSHLRYRARVCMCVCMCL